MKSESIIKDKYIEFTWLQYEKYYFQYCHESGSDQQSNTLNIKE